MQSSASGARCGAQQKVGLEFKMEGHREFRHVDIFSKTPRDTDALPSVSRIGPFHLGRFPGYQFGHIKPDPITVS